MKSLVKVLRAQAAQSKIPLALDYPYEYTINSTDFSLEDIRFKELPFSRQFAKPEGEHIHHTLTTFESILNNGKSLRNDEEFLQKSLVAKTLQLREILSQSNIKVNFTFEKGSITKSAGYLQIKPEDDISLREKDLKFIHLYRFERDRQTLSVRLKAQKQVLTAEEQLKKDIADKMGENTKEFREKLDSMRFSKQALFADRFLSKLMSIGKRQPKKSFQPYFIVDQIKGFMKCQMTYQGKVYEENKLEFDSKWLYWVNNLESQDLKKHRKRTLFDFQYWNRGNFFPIRNYVAEIAHLK